MPNRFRGSCPAIVGLVALGCGADEPSNAPSREELTWSSAPEWSAELDLRIGSVDDPDYALTSFRAMEVGEDGTIYTLHPAERVVRRFDADGSLLSVFGGSGDGPGEFQGPGGMGWVADSLWVFDYLSYRFSFFTPSGDFLTSFSVPYGSISDLFAVQPPRASGLLFDGTVWGEPPTFSHLVANGTMTHRQPMLMARDGRVTDTLPSVEFGRNQWAITPSDGSGGYYRNQPFADGPLSGFTFRERAIVVVAREAPATADRATFSVSKLAFTGDTLFSRSIAFDPQPVDAAELDSLLDAVGEELSEIPMFGMNAIQGREQAETTLYVPAFRPGVTQLRIAKDDGIWLAGDVDGLGATEWLVLDPDGRSVGRVALPSTVNPLVIDPPFLWGSERGELDVPYVVRYRVEGR
jgi:hypothetical protein